MENPTPYFYLVHSISGFGFISFFAAAVSAKDKLSSCNATFWEMAALTVSLLSKHKESFFDTAAAVTVLICEDTRRSGVLHLPDILCMASGVEVGQSGSRSYNDTERGEVKRFPFVKVDWRR